MRRIRTYHEVPDPGSAEVLEQVLEQRRRLAERLGRVRAVVAVASGKGGVGKSAVTANLAAALAARGHRVGAADADLNGPSLARMLGAAGQPLRVTGDGVHPATGAAGVRVISMDLLLETDEAPVRWREPDEGAFIWQSTLETGALREFLADVVWGELDFLLVDVPPGTDKLGRLLQLVAAPARVLLVTTPSEAARFVVAKSARMLADSGTDAGLVANMTAYHCPCCGEAAPLYEADGARRLAEAAGLPLWAEVPFDPGLAASTDAGSPFVLRSPDSPAARALLALTERVATWFAAPPAADPYPTAHAAGDAGAAPATNPESTTDPAAARYPAPSTDPDPTADPASTRNPAPAMDPAPATDPATAPRTRPHPDSPGPSPSPSPGPEP